MKDYLQPAATFALALSIASLGFTLPRTAKSNPPVQVIRVEFPEELIHTARDPKIRAIRFVQRRG